MDSRMPRQYLSDTSEEYFQHNRRTVQRHQLFSGSIDSQYGYLTPYLKKWVLSPFQPLIVVNYQGVTEEPIKGLCVDLVEQFKENSIPVIWLMRGPEFPPKKPITTHILRSLTMQASSHPFHILVGNENELSEFEYLEAVLAEFENIFIVVDSSVLGYGQLGGGNVHYPWVPKFLQICDNHRLRFREGKYPPKVGVKIALAIRGRERWPELPGPQWDDRWLYVNITAEELLERQTDRQMGD